MKKGQKKGEVMTVSKYLLNIDQTTMDLLNSVEKVVSISEFSNRAELFRAALKLGLSKMLEKE